MNPIIFRLGPFEVRWYGVLIMLGVALGAYFGARLARKRGLDTNHVWNALIVAVILAIIGAGSTTSFRRRLAARRTPPMPVAGPTTGTTSSRRSPSGREASRAWASTAPSSAVLWASSSTPCLTG